MILASIFIGGAALIFALILAALAVFFPVLYFLWARIYRVQDIADEVYFARTDDGWNIPLHYHRPANPRPGALPVIFSHGIAVNKYGVDLDIEHSLAYYLKQNGFSVFVIGLRGTDRSRPMSGKKNRDFSFDDIVNYDVPAAIRAVLNLTEAPKVNWVGHSMGAMIAFAFLGRELPLSERVVSLTSIGGPGSLKHAQLSIWGIASRHPWIGRVLDLRFGSQALSPLLGRISTPIEDMVFNRRLVNGTTIRRVSRNAVENIAPGLARQFSDWIQGGHQRTRDGSVDYRDTFGNIEIPVLFLAGVRDHLAPPESVRYLYDAIGSRKKRMRVLGKQYGQDEDYCHTGLVLADTASRDVFPGVLEWLLQYGVVKRKARFLSRIFSKKGELRT